MCRFVGWLKKLSGEDQWVNQCLMSSCACVALLLGTLWQTTFEMSSREKLERAAKKSVNYVEGVQEQDVLDGEEVLSDVFEPEVNPNVDETENGGEMTVLAPVPPLPNEAELDRFMEESQQ